MKKFLILAETESVGYFVEIHELYEVALKREKLFFELAFNPPTDRESMRNEFAPIGSYKINDQYGGIFFKSLGGTCNGFYSTYILEIDETFSFEKFASLRNSSRKVLFNDGDKELYELEEKYGEGISNGGWVN
jgi:hypothetical protein